MSNPTSKTNLERIAVDRELVSALRAAAMGGRGDTLTVRKDRVERAKELAKQHGLSHVPVQAVPKRTP